MGKILVSYFVTISGMENLALSEKALENIATFANIFKIIHFSLQFELVLHFKYTLSIHKSNKI